MNRNEKESAEERKKERERQTDRRYQPDRTRESMTIIEKLKRIDFIASLSHDCLFFFFNELNKKGQEVSMREKYSAPRTLFEALLFTVDILTMINTFVYFFSKNFFSRPRGRGSIIDFNILILGNY